MNFNPMHTANQSTAGLKKFTKGVASGDATNKNKKGKSVE